VSDIPTNSLRDYADLLGHVKSRIRQAQSKAILAANAEMIRLYWDIGRLVAQQQQLKGWGSSVIPRLARDSRLYRDRCTLLWARHLSQAIGKRRVAWK
jgi:hypothetical protein